MFKKEIEVINWVNNRLRFGMRPGLERLKEALKQLGNPHLALKTIHIAGTNGKGSTVTFLSAVLQAAGYRTGTFTSPFIETFNERISLNGTPICEVDLVQCANAVYEIIEGIDQTELGPFTEFEIITLLSFVYFKNQNVDFVIYEVGLGGRLDATNVIMPLVCGITNIGHDHQEILGDTLVKIAHEKLGIVKEGIPLFTTEERPELLPEFEKVTAMKNSCLTQALIKCKPTNVKLDAMGTTFDWPQLKNVRLSMKGAHQVKNATLAYGVIDYLKTNHGLKITDANLYEGMKQAFWKGRFEVLRQNPLIILDGAHNIEGVTQLCVTLQNTYPNKRQLFIVSILKNKNSAEMLEIIKQEATHIYFTTFDYPGAETALKQYEAFNEPNTSYEEDSQQLVDQLIPTLTEEDCLIITGSLYFISQMRNYLKRGCLVKKELQNEKIES